MNNTEMRLRVLQLRRVAPLPHDQDDTDAEDIQMLHVGYAEQASVMRSLRMMASNTADAGLSRLRMRALDAR